jgi:predicted dehydrogenase
MRNDPPRIGVIGAGYWGPNIIRNFVELPQADVAAVADLDEMALNRIRTRYPRITHAVEDFRDLLHRDLDAVAICTPPQTHHAIARQCLEAGLHVLVEKPLTTDPEEAVDLIHLAEANHLTLMVGHTFQYNPAVHALKAMIERGELGDIHYIDAVRVGLGLFHPSLNVAWDLGPHDVSILIHLLDELPETVTARGVGCIQPGVEDVVYVSLGFPGGVLAHLRLSWLDPNKTRRLTVIGNKKMVIYDDVESLEKVRVYDKGVEAIRRTDTFGEFQFAYRYGNIVSPYIHFEEPLMVECRHFLDCIRTGATPVTDGRNGLRVVEVIDAAQHSLRSGGGTVAVRYRDPDAGPATPTDVIDLRAEGAGPHLAGHDGSAAGCSDANPLLPAERSA